MDLANPATPHGVRRPRVSAWCAPSVHRRFQHFHLVIGRLHARRLTVWRTVFLNGFSIAAHRACIEER
jgi:hypothetical protein